MGMRVVYQTLSDISNCDAFQFKLFRCYFFVFDALDAIDANTRNKYHKHNTRKK